MIENFRIKTECAVCPTKIWQRAGVRLKKSHEYHETTVRLNNLSKMTVGVCSRHTEPSKSELKQMTEKIHQGWLEEAALGIGNEEWVMETGMKLKIVARGI